MPTLDSIQRFMSSYEQAQLWQAPDFNQYHLNYEPELPSEAERRLLVRHAARPRPGDLRPLRRRGRASRSTCRRRRSPTTRPSAPSSRPTSRTPSTSRRPRRDRLLAAQQGLADAAVGPLQQRIRPGRQLLRREEGQRAAARALRLRHRRRLARQPLERRADRGSDGARRSVYDLKGKLLDERSASSLSVAAQGVAERVLTPQVPAATAPPPPAKTYFVELRHQAGRQPSSTATSTGSRRRRTSSTGQGHARQTAGRR